MIQAAVLFSLINKFLVSEYFCKCLIAAFNRSEIHLFFSFVLLIFTFFELKIKKIKKIIIF